MGRGITERELEERVAAKPLDEPAMQQKAQFNQMIASQAPPLSDVAYTMVASALANEGMAPPAAASLSCSSRSRRS